MKVLIIAIMIILAAYTVSAVPAEPFCTDSDGGADIWTPGSATSDQGTLEDDCDGASENLKEATCNDQLNTHPDNIKCSDYGAICITADGPDYCSCPQGTTFNGTSCETNEVVIPVCGNNVVEELEACDDGNTESFDGCSARCTIEDNQIPEFSTIASG